MVSLLRMKYMLLPHCVGKRHIYCSKNKQSGSVCLERQRKMLMETVLLCVSGCAHAWIILCLGPIPIASVNMYKLQVWNAAACRHNRGYGTHANALQAVCRHEVRLHLQGQTGSFQSLLNVSAVCVRWSKTMCIGRNMSYTIGHISKTVLIQQPIFIPQSIHSPILLKKWK